MNFIHDTILIYSSVNIVNAYLCGFTNLTVDKYTDTMKPTEHTNNA